MPRISSILPLVLFCLALFACSDTARDTTAPASAPTVETSQPTTSPVDDNSLKLVFLGDSLTAGLGLDEADAHPAVLEDLLLAAGYDVRVVNAGVSGDTTAGGLRRLDWLLRQEPDVLVISLGANDGLRALPIEDSEANLRAIVRRAREAGVRVLLTGMRVPPNYGPDYAERFAALFPRLADELDVPLVDFLLEGVGGMPELNQADGIHPTAEGQRRVAENLLPALRALLDQPAAEE